jgi:hypothetical protein
MMNFFEGSFHNQWINNKESIIEVVEKRLIYLELDRSGGHDQHI